MAHRAKCVEREKASRTEVRETVSDSAVQRVVGLEPSGNLVADSRWFLGNGFAH